MNKENIDIYANGIVHCSVCVPESMPKFQVEMEINRLNPSGVGKWEISKDKKFHTGEVNPHPCENNPKQVHYLMVC